MFERRTSHGSSDRSASASASVSRPRAVEMLESLTRQAASALENARLHQQLADRERRLQDLANRLFETREEERRRVACDIHDGLVQVAAVAHQNLRAYAEAHAPGSTPSRERLDRALQLVGLTVKEGDFSL